MAEYINAVRVKLDYTQSDGFLGGSRFYIAYASGIPTSGNLDTLASDVATAWNDELTGLINEDWTLTEVDCFDLSSETGLSGYWTGSHVGTRSGDVLPANVATNVEYNIARRYRGGKPRMYLPPPCQGDLQTPEKWLTDFQGEVNTDVPAFFSAIEALSIGAMGALTHQALSFYKGWDTTMPVVKKRGTFYPPKPRDAPLADDVAGYACKLEVSSQRRRRLATTP
jgi:hypothetical protein